MFLGWNAFEILISGGCDIVLTYLVPIIKDQVNMINTLTQIMPRVGSSERHHGDSAMEDNGDRGIPLKR